MGLFLNLITYNEPRFIFCEIVLMQTFFRFFKNVPRVNTTKHKLFVLATCVCLLLTGALLYIPDVVHVSSSVSGRELPIYCVQTDKPQIALTFDAAWGNEDTKQILSILEKHRVSATFFMTGGWVSSYPQDVTAIFEAGHDLGNHSENHKNMSKLSTDEMTQELSAVHGNAPVSPAIRRLFKRSHSNRRFAWLLYNSVGCGFSRLEGLWGRFHY